MSGKHLRGLRAFKEEGLQQRYVVVSLDPTRRRTDDGIELLKVARSIHPDMEQQVVTFAEKLRQEGRVDARRQVLLELLEVKFGTPAPETVSHIENASAEKLEAWLRRIVIADSSAAVFEG